MDENRCTGWWEQADFGRHEMEGLILYIQDKKISGSGYDVVGMFTLEGTLDDQNGVSIAKDYLGAHRVLYKGFYNGNDRLWGIWIMSFDSGPWEIRLRNSNSEKEKEEEVEKMYA